MEQDGSVARLRRLAFAVAWTEEAAALAAQTIDGAPGEVPIWAAHNRARGITGLIAPSRDGVIQAIEGPEEQVAHLLSEIAADRRVAALSVLLREWDRKRMAPGHGLIALIPARRQRFFHDAENGLPPRPRLDAEAQMAGALAALLQSGLDAGSGADAARRIA